MVNVVKKGERRAKAKPHRAREPRVRETQEPGHVAAGSSRFLWHVVAIWAIAFGIRFAFIWQIQSVPVF